MSEFYINEFPQGVENSKKEYVVLSDYISIPNDGAFAEIRFENDKERTLFFKKEELNDLGLDKNDVREEFEVYLENEIIKGFGNKY